MRKISTFELIDGELIKQELWINDSTRQIEEKELDYYLQAAGLDSEMFQFTFGFPLYVLILSFFLFIVLPFINCIRNGCPEALTLEKLEGGEQEGT